MNILYFRSVSTTISWFISCPTSNTILTSPVSAAKSIQVQADYFFTIGDGTNDSALISSLAEQDKKNCKMDTMLQCEGVKKHNLAKLYLIQNNPKYVYDESLHFSLVLLDVSNFKHRTAEMKVLLKGLFISYQFAHQLLRLVRSSQRLMVFQLK